MERVSQETRCHRLSARLLIAWVSIVSLVCMMGVAAGMDEDPGSRWATAYAWVRTGENLAEAELWPLALGSYIEADRLLIQLSASDPGFEPEMVAFRHKALQESIVTTQERLTTDEHETMMKYLDFIESLELGESQRYSNQYSAARDTLEMAKMILEEIAGDKPDSFRNALATQYSRLQSSLTWVSAQIQYREAALHRPSSGGADLYDSSDRGTTAFVTIADLPSDPGLPGPSALFPGVPLITPSTAPENSSTSMPDSSSGAIKSIPKVRRFRMHPDERLTTDSTVSEEKIESEVSQRKN